jgi:hypothetical protein
MYEDLRMIGSFVLGFLCMGFANALAKDEYPCMFKQSELACRLKGDSLAVLKRLRDTFTFGPAGAPTEDEDWALSDDDLNDDEEGGPVVSPVAERPERGGGAPPESRSSSRSISDGVLTPSASRDPLAERPFKLYPFVM